MPTVSIKIPTDRPPHRPRCSSFSGYNLSGTLPDQLGALASLQTLVLSDNHLVGTPSSQCGQEGGGG